MRVPAFPKIAAQAALPAPALFLLAGSSPAGSSSARPHASVRLTRPDACPGPPLTARARRRPGRPPAVVPGRHRCHPPVLVVRSRLRHAPEQPRKSVRKEVKWAHPADRVAKSVTFFAILLCDLHYKKNCAESLHFFRHESVRPLTRSMNRRKGRPPWARLSADATGKDGRELDHACSAPRTRQGASCSAPGFRRNRGRRQAAEVHDLRLP